MATETTFSREICDLLKIFLSQAAAQPGLSDSLKVNRASLKMRIPLQVQVVVNEYILVCAIFVSHLTYLI